MPNQGAKLTNDWERSIAEDQRLAEKGASKEQEAAKDIAWRRGYLRWKLDSNQKRAYDAIEASAAGSFYFNKARRVGGSYLLCLRAIEQCLKKPDAQVKYAAPTAKAVRKIIQPNIRKILADCPKELRPKWNSLDMEYKFPNGSTITTAGCENQNFENLRGTEADEIYMDEVGFIDDLGYVIDDVLMPQIQDTNGKIILTSTPPRSPGHESVRIAMNHKSSGRFYQCTVWDNPRRTKAQHDAFFADRAASKGMGLDEYYASVTFRREYLGEFVADEEKSVIPEWCKALEDHLVRTIAEHKHRDSYVALDVGWKDGMAALFGYWDFHGQRLIIQDEYLVYKKTTDFVAEGILAKELQLWGNRKPYLRISDNNLQFIADLNSKPGICFVPTAKDNKELQINKLREWIRLRKIYIHPRCVKLVTQLASTTWNKSRTSYERTADGHGDLLDALVYMVRNVRTSKNPYPRGIEDRDNHQMMTIFKDGPSGVEDKLVAHFAPDEYDEF